MYKTKTGLYRKQVTINGVRKVFSGKTQRDVMLKIAEYQAQQKKGVTFSDAVEEWYQDCETRLTVNSLHIYRYSANILLSRFADRPINEITPQELQRFMTDFAKTRPKKTVTHVQTILKQIYKYANFTHDLRYNPTDSLTLPKAQKGRDRHYPTDADIEIITAHVNDDYGLFPYLALYTGLRRGELSALRWQDIDFQRRLIHVRHNITWSPYPSINIPKTESSIRDVPMIDAVANVLQPQEPNQYVFGGDAPLSRQTVTATIPNHLKRLGVQCTLHELRHGFASMLFRQGLDIQSISKILGHSSINVTMAVYLHEMDTSYIDTARTLLEQIHTTHTPTPKNP